MKKKKKEKLRKINKNGTFRNADKNCSVQCSGECALHFTGQFNGQIIVK